MHLFSDRYFKPQFLYEGENDKGSSVTVEWPDEVRQGFKNLVSRQGGEGDAARKLYEENYENRKQIRELKDKLENANTLSDEELQNFKTYKKINDDPEKLQEVIQNAEQDTDELNKLKRDKQNASVADVQGWNPNVLNRLAEETAEFEIKTRQVDGEDQKYGVIKTEDGEKELTAYANDHWAEMMPALKVNGQEKDTKTGKSFASQSSSSNGKKDSGYLKKAIAKNHEAAGVKE